MEDHTKSGLVGAVQRVVELLVAGEFLRAEELTGGVRLSAEAIKRAVNDYGGVLTRPPDTAFDRLDAIQVQGSAPPRWSIRFDLWTEEEGQSDLTLEMTVEEGPQGPKIALDDIHIL